MKIQLAVVGAGSLIGRPLCRRAVRLGWDVNAFSVSECYSQYDYKNRLFYNSHLSWEEHVSWNVSMDYDIQFEALHDEIRNATGVVYIHEYTPAMKNSSHTFEECAIKLAKIAGDWSVRHFIAVDTAINDNRISISEDWSHLLAENVSPWMIVSLLKTGQIYSYDRYYSCFKVLRNRTIKSIGFEVDPISMINADTVAKCITTLIHNTNDPNVYRILDSTRMEQYLHAQKIPFDSPNEEKDTYDDINDEDEYGDNNNRMSSQAPQFFKWNVPQNTNDVLNENDEQEHVIHIQEHHNSDKHKKKQSSQL